MGGMGVAATWGPDEPATFNCRAPASRAPQNAGGALLAPRRLPVVARSGCSPILPSPQRRTIWPRDPATPDTAPYAKRALPPVRLRHVDKPVNMEHPPRFCERGCTLSPLQGSVPNPNILLPPATAPHSIKRQPLLDRTLAHTKGANRPGIIGVRLNFNPKVCRSGDRLHVELVQTRCIATRPPRTHESNVQSQVRPRPCLFHLRTKGCTYRHETAIRQHVMSSLFARPTRYGHHQMSDVMWTSDARPN